MERASEYSFEDAVSDYRLWRSGKDDEEEDGLDWSIAYKAQRRLMNMVYCDALGALLILEVVCAELESERSLPTFGLRAIQELIASDIAPTSVNILPHLLSEVIEHDSGR